MKVLFWLIAMACGAAQVLQAMTNGSAARLGLGAIWTGAISATASVAALSLTALLFYRLPFPHAGVLSTQGPKVVLGGLLGAFNLAGLTFVAPRLGPTQTFLAYFFVILVTSALIDSLGIFGTDAKPLAAHERIVDCPFLSKGNNSILSHGVTLLLGGSGGLITDPVTPPS